MGRNRDAFLAQLKGLFEEAKSEGGIEYIYSLVRVSGLSSGVADPLVELHSILQASDMDVSDEELFSRYYSPEKMEEPLSLVANLLNCSIGRPYNLSPFHHLYAGEVPRLVRPNARQIVRELVKMSTEAKKPGIAELIKEAYPDEVLQACWSGGSSHALNRLRAATQKSRLFLISLLQNYFTERLGFRNQTKLYKLPGFQVLELLVNDGNGLYGFRIHFSNDSSATFARHLDSTECTNVIPRVPINFMAGDLGRLRHEWRIEGRRLYELGLPGRYNKLGEWKPIIYPGNSEDLQKDACSLSEDSDVQGTLFYMMCTGHRVVEFVICTNIELPTESLSFGDKVHLWKCPSLGNIPHVPEKVRVYDGWLELESWEPESIMSAIATIGVLINMIVFTFGGVAEWRLKYRMTLSDRACPSPNEEDLHVLDSMLSMLRNFQGTEESIILHASIEWYSLGRSSQNILIEFLCYYIALESLAMAIANGDADFGLSYPQEEKKEGRQRRIDCIKEKHNIFYSKDPIRFVQDAYSECVVGIKKKTYCVTELVFGRGHKYVKALFSKNDGYSLWEIRCKIAHGEATLVDREDERLVRGRLGEMATISKEFLVRVGLPLRPGDPLPSWSRHYSFPMLFADPRTTLVATNEAVLPSKDWRIRPEWCGYA